MGWKQIPVGPFNLSGDSDPKLSADLNTQGYGVKLSDTLPNQGYSGIIVKGQIDPSATVGHIMAFDTNAADGLYYNASSVAASTVIPVIGVLVETYTENSESYGKILINGLFKNNSLGLPAKGSLIYAGVLNSNSNTGISFSPPGEQDTGSFVQSIGYVWDNADGNKIIYVKPSQTVMRVS